MDPTKVDERSGVEHDAILTDEDCRALLYRAWGPMHEHRVTIQARPYERDGVTEGIVIVARGETARRLQTFAHDDLWTRPSE